MTDLEHYFHLYGMGCLGGLLTALVMLVLGNTVDSLSYLNHFDQITNFYPAIVWGGVGALLYMIPLEVPSWWKALLFSIPVAIIHQAHRYGWVGDGLFGGADFNKLLTEPAMIETGIFILCWGVFTSQMLKEE